MPVKKPRRFTQSKTPVISPRPAVAASEDGSEMKQSSPVNSERSTVNQIPDPAASNFYPHIDIPYNTTPNRWYAAPIFGGLVKIIMLIPVGFWLFLVGTYTFFLALYNGFYVLFTGKYSAYCYRMFLNVMNLSCRTMFFWAGLTDTYPGFSLTKNHIVTIDMPLNPSKLWAFPIFGGIIRIIFMIPFGIYQQVVSRAANIGVIASSVPVLFKGYYPESTFQLTKDSYRLSLATTSYVLGLRDDYPSFWISMKHQTIVVILIILGALNIIFSNNSGTHTTPSTSRTTHVTPTNY